MPGVVSFSWEDVDERLDRLLPAGTRKVYGVPRGGAIVAGLLRQRGIQVVGPDEAEVIVDDIIDSGETAKRYSERYGKPIAVLVNKEQEGLMGVWVEFPWEGGREGDLRDGLRRIIQTIGDDPDRTGLIETPDRVIAVWNELFSGYREQPGDVIERAATGDGRHGRRPRRALPLDLRTAPAPVLGEGRCRLRARGALHHAGEPHPSHQSLLAAASHAGGPDAPDRPGAGRERGGRRCRGRPRPARLRRASSVGARRRVPHHHVLLWHVRDGRSGKGGVSARGRVIP